MNRPNYLLFRKCNKCNRILHISKLKTNKSSKYGVEKTCKECDYKNRKKHREKNQDYYNEYNKKYYEEHKEDIIKKNSERNKDNKNYKEWKKKYDKEYRKKYRKEHEEELREYNRKYNKKYYEEHKEELKDKKKQYYKNNPQISFNSFNRRRVKKESQGNGITKEQWYEMMEFFDWKCAYSGEYIGGDNKDKKRTIDHIVALDNGGEHEIWNCIPMLKSYNSQKRIFNMLEWYLEQPFFSIERLTKIYEWRIYAYEKWGKGYDYDNK